MTTNNIINKIFIISITAFLLTQPALAGSKFKCWTNNEGVKECGSYVPPEYSQKRIETRSKAGRVIDVDERAKNKEELAEIKRLDDLKKIEDAKIAEQNKKDSILLKTFTRERDINMLRDSKVNVIEGIITVTNSNNKTLQKKLEKYQKKAANIERSGKKPPAALLNDIETIEQSINKNNAAITAKRAEQDLIRKKFDQDLERFRKLKNKTKGNQGSVKKP